MMATDNYYMIDTKFYDITRRFTTSVPPLLIHRRQRSTRHMFILFNWRKCSRDIQLIAIKLSIHMSEKNEINVEKKKKDIHWTCQMKIESHRFRLEIC
jgi:hypothetical protein